MSAATHKDERVTPTWAALIEGAIDRALAEVRVSVPGEVVSYDADTQTAAVQPLIKFGTYDETGDRQVETVPIVHRVPVMFCDGAGGGLTVPIAKGDGVLLICSHASLEQWKKKGGIVDPENDQHHHIEDAIAIVGLYSPASPRASRPNAVVLRGTDVRLGGDAATDPVVRQSDLQTLVNSIAAAVLASAGSFLDGGALFHTTLVGPPGIPMPTCSGNVKST